MSSLSHAKKISQESGVKDPFLDEMLNLAYESQNKIGKSISSIDGSPFNPGERLYGIETVSCKSKFLLIENSRLFEKGNVILTETFGQFVKETADISTFQKIKQPQVKFHAVSCSMVFHPNHPMIPSMHANYFLVITDSGTFWYNGGGDLTPPYIFEEDCRYYHMKHKELCDKHLGEGWHSRLKKIADKYFFLKHRNHCRGIGGTFFENFNDKGVQGEMFNTGHTKESIYKYVKNALESIVDMYCPLIEKRQHLSYNEDQKHFMKLIRSRYSEFNLMYDKGVRFGIETGIPADIPLMCMPNSDWEYDWENKYDATSPEHKTLEILRHPRDWI